MRDKRWRMWCVGQAKAFDCDCEERVFCYHRKGKQRRRYGHMRDTFTRHAKFRRIRRRETVIEREREKNGDIGEFAAICVFVTQKYRRRATANVLDLPLLPQFSIRLRRIFAATATVATACRVHDREPAIWIWNHPVALGWTPGVDLIQLPSLSRPAAASSTRRRTNHAHRHRRHHRHCGALGARCRECQFVCRVGRNS